MNCTNKIGNIKRLVIKVGSSTLTHNTERLNLKKIDELAKVLTDLFNQGIEVVLVTSGAIAAGRAKLGLKEKPKTTKEKQAIASIGQCELMHVYDKFFNEYSQNIAQMLLTKTITQDDILKTNTLNTLETLLDYKVIPIINENDTIAIDEIVYGDNDTLSAVTATLVKADLLIILSDIDGLYTSNPNVDKDAKIINVVEDINDDIISMAGGTNSSVGTGGMITKIHAAKLCVDNGVNMVISNGNDIDAIYDIIEGNIKGTLFVRKD